MKALSIVAGRRLSGVIVQIVVGAIEEEYGFALSAVKAVKFVA